MEDKAQLKRFSALCEKCPNTEFFLIYIHKESNHPPSNLRQIPLSIKFRLSKHSCNEKIFKGSTQIYQEALKKSGYDHQLSYQKSINNKNEETKQSKRKIIWFNPHTARMF